MADTIDSLQIEINAKATKANDAIDRLVGKLDRLTTSLSRVNGTNLNGLANGVQRLGNAMQVMNTIKTADFTRLATNLTKLGTVNVSALNSAASSMSHLTRAFNSLGTVSANAQSVGEMAKNIAKLGNKSVQTAITNIPRLATALNNLMITLSKSPKVSQNVIQMTNALANLANQGSKVGSASNSIVRGLNKTSTSANTAKKSFGGLASAIGKFYATYFMVIRGLKGLWSSIKGTADYIEAYNYFNVALGKIGSDWSYQFEKYGYKNAESYAESFKTRLSDSLGKLSGVQVSIGADGKGLLTESGMKNLGLNIQEITQYASQLASVTNSVGQTGEVSLAVASSFTKLAGDISSLFNVDYSSVSKNLQSGLIGQSRALYKYGIDITNATLQTYAYNLGLSKSVSEMTQAEKMQLRMLAILDQSKVSWGDLANTINSPSNMIRQFKNNLKEAGMVLGQLFIPVLQKVLPVINGVAIAIKRLLVNIAGLLGIKIDFDSFGQGYSNIEDELDTSADAFENATQKAEEYKNQLLGFDEVEKVSEPTDKSNASANTSNPIDLTSDILKATSEYEKAWEKAYEKMQNRSEKFANAISKALKPISTIFEDIAKGDWLKLGKDTSKLVTDIFNFFSSAIKKVNWTKLGKNIGKFLVGINWISILKSVGKTIVLAFDSAISTYIGMWKTAPLESAIITAIGVMKFSKLPTVLGNVIEKALGKKITLKKGAIGLALATGSIYLANSKSEIKKFIAAPITAMLAAMTFGANIKLALGIGAVTLAAVSIKEAIKKAAPWFFEDNVIPYEIDVSVGASYEKVKKAIEALNSDFEQYKNNSKSTIENSEVEAEVIDKLWKEYQKLADKQTLSKKQQSSLLTLSGQLIDKVPELSNLINAQTGKYKGQKKEIQAIIDKTKEKIKLEATQAVYAEALKEQIKAEKKVREITTNNDYVNALAKKKEAQNALTKATKAYNDFLKENPTPGEYTPEMQRKFEQLGIAVGKAESGVNAAEKAIGSWEEELESAESVLISASQDVDYYGKKMGLASSVTDEARKKTKEYREESNRSASKIANNTENMANKVNSSLKKITFPKSLATTASTVIGNIQKTLNGIKMPDLAKKFTLTPIINMFQTAKNNINEILGEIKEPSLFENFTIGSDGKTLLPKRKPGEIVKKAGGGFVGQGQLFVAREAGPELVGTMNGDTAVANNDQIVAGISSGVYPAVYNAVVQAMSGIKGGSNGDIVIQIDGKEVFKAVQKQADNYTMQNSKPAFMI